MVTRMSYNNNESSKPTLSFLEMAVVPWMNCIILRLTPSTREKQTSMLQSTSDSIIDYFVVVGGCTLNEFGKCYIAGCAFSFLGCYYWHNTSGKGMNDVAILFWIKLNCG